MITGLLFYLIWVLFIVSFTIMISAIFQTQGIIALISIVFLLACRIIVGLNPIIDQVNPASMSKHAMEMLVTGSECNRSGQCTTNDYLDLIDTLLNKLLDC